jgi:DNA-binding response OmpR family regulator
MDGISLSVQALERFPQLRIIVITGYAEQQQRAALLDGRIGDFLTKPFSLKEICAAASAALIPPQETRRMSAAPAPS